MTRIVNYIPREWTKNNLQPSGIEWTNGVLTLTSEGGSNETIAQSGTLTIEQPGVYVVAGRCLNVTLPDSGENKTSNGVLPVWETGNWSKLLVSSPKTVEAKSYAIEFQVPDTVTGLVLRVCAPNGGGAVWDRLFLGLKTDWQALQGITPSFISESHRLFL